MDNDNLTTTFVKLRTRLKMMAGRILGDDDEAEDALQDAFCKLWQRRETITSSAAAEGLSVVTVRNICIDSVRHKAVLDTVPQDESKEIADVAEDLGRGRDELFDEVDKIMASQRAETQRTILRMREYEGAAFDAV